MSMEVLKFNSKPLDFRDDDDFDEITFDATFSALIDGMITINGPQLLFYGSPDASHVGEYIFTAQATD